ncbi:MAG: hypothetical protein WC709_01810 [Thermoleophilia bacterium]
MDRRSPIGVGWPTFSAVALIIGGVFALISGLMAVYQSSFFAQNAVFAFSDLNTWGWIVFGLGSAGIISGLAVLTGRESARWLGITVAALGALGQLLFAQAYPLWSLMIMAVDFLVVYGLVVYGVSERIASASSSLGESREVRGTAGVSDVNERTRRAA